MYHTINTNISKAKVKKMAGHLWYLSEQLFAISFFEDYLDKSTKDKMVFATKQKKRDEKQQVCNFRRGTNSRDFSRLCDQDIRTSLQELASSGWFPRISGSSEKASISIASVLQNVGDPVRVDPGLWTLGRNQPSEMSVCSIAHLVEHRIHWDASKY